MIGEVAGRERMSTAMSLDVGASNASRMVGPCSRRIPARRDEHSRCFYSKCADVLHRAMGDYYHPLALEV
jgi:hypothetical protein